MKRIIYTFCVAIGTLLAISCSKSENSVEKQVKTSGFNIPAEAKAIIPEEFIGKMAANGMTINEGTNPPNIQGIFATGILKMIYTSLNYDTFPIGKEIESYRFKFYEQRGTKIKTDYINEDILDEETGELDGYIVEELSYDPLLAGFKSGDYETDSELLLFHEDWIEVFNRDEEDGTASVCGVAEGDDSFELFGITLLNVIRKKKNQMKEYIRLQKGEDKDGV